MLHNKINNTKKLYSFIAMFSAIMPAYGEDNNIERLVTTLNVNEKGAVAPDFFIPYYWSKHIFSGAGFLTRDDSKQDVLKGFDKSRLSEDNKQLRWRLTMLAWQSKQNQFNYSVGAELNYLTIKKLEFGYAYFPPNLGDDWVAFDNKVDISVTRPTVRSNLMWSNLGNTFVIRAEALVYPVSNLQVSQRTEFKPIVDSTGINKNKKTQDLSWEFSTDAIVKTPLFVDLDLAVSYEYLPLSYGLSILERDSNTLAYSFSDTTINSELTTLNWSLNFILKKKIIGDAYPVFGIGQRISSTKDTDSGVSGRNTERLFNIGFEQLF